MTYAGAEEKYRKQKGREKRKRTIKKRCYREEGGERSMKNREKNIQKIKSKN